MTEKSGGRNTGPLYQDAQEDALESALDRLTISKSSSSTSRQPSPARSTRRASSLSTGRESQPGSPRRRSSNIGYDGAPASSSPRLKQKTSSSNLSPKPQIRRAPSNSSLRSVQAHDHADPSPRPTAGSIARDYFQKELELHANALHELTVFIHDSCYGHRWARPKTSKASLGMIVERPERLRAAALGISSAYVRSGGRHAGGADAPAPLQVPSTHSMPFCIRRSSRHTSLSLASVTAVHGTKWMQELTAMCDMAQARLANGQKELTRPDTPTGSEKPHWHEGDLYLCKDSLEAMQGALGGVLDAVDTVFEQKAKRAFVCIRPPGHHCSADLPSGFCWLNNVHVGIEHAAQTYGLTHAAIIDFDLHHGDGSQTITWERNMKAAKAAKNAALHKKATTGYFSLHDINSYPCEWGDLAKVTAASVCMENSHNQTIWNVHLQPWRTEEEFWALYESRYKVLLVKARNYLRQQTERFKAMSNVRPKAAIFISAGFDASEWEGQGMQRHKVNVPTAFYARFTRDIRQLAEEEGTSVNGRIISVLEGGYSDRALTSGVLSHLTGLLSMEELHAEASWWAAAALIELEATHAPPPPPVAGPRRPRNTDTPTYQTPTQSFTAKVVDPTKIYRTASGTSHTPPRSPTPPTPEVDWQTAAHEFGKLLIPSDRTTVSCRYEELNEPKAPKQERHSTIGLPRVEAPKMQPKRELRTRKAKMPTYPEQSEPESDHIKVSKTHRRRTTGDAMLLSVDNAAIHNTLESDSAPLPADPSSSATSQSTATAAPHAASTKAPSRRASIGRPASRVASNGRSAVPAVSKVVRDSADVEDLSVNFRKIRLDLNKPASNGAASNAITTAKPANKKPVVATQTVALSKPSTAEITTNRQADSRVGTSSIQQNSTSKPPEKGPGDISNHTDSSDRPIEGQQVQGSPSENSSAQQKLSMQTSASVNTHTAAQHIMVNPHKAIEHDGTSQQLLSTPQSERLDVPSTGQSTNPTSVTPPQVRPSADQSSNSPPRQMPGTSFIPFIPADGPSTATQIQQAPLTWLPPNTNTPSQTPIKRTKEDLPRFNAGGHIPFAGRSGDKVAQAGSKADDGKTDEIWNVPDTPGQ